MFASKEKAELIARLSYEEYEYLKSMNIEGYENSLITYKKALELDDDTADKVLERLIKRSNELKFKEIAALNMALVKYIGPSLTIIDNYQYVDYYKYELNKPKDKAKMEIKFIDGDIHHFNVANLTITKDMVVVQKTVYGETFYAPHIYEPLFLSKEFKIDNLTELEMYLKLLIIEDREVNPYIFSGKHGTKIVLTMKEKVEYLDKYRNDIEFLDNLLKATGGFLMFDPSTELLTIKPMKEYLESVEKSLLIDLLSEYDNKKKLKTLSYILKLAEKEIYGLVINGTSSWVKLL